MDYEQAYKQALERAKSAIKDCGDNKGCIAMIESIFPELGESEDERIRKEILIYLDWLDGRKGYTPKGVYSIKDMIAWLEKQGKKQPIIVWHSINEEPEEMKELFCEWESDDATWHDVAFYDNESHTFRHAKMPINVTKWIYVDELLGKQGDQKTDKYEGYCEGCNNVKGCVTCVDGDQWAHYKEVEQKPTVVDFNAKDWYVSKVDGKIHDLTYNPADKLELKFKVGEWVVNSLGDVWHIDSFDNKNYQVSNGDKYCYFPIEKQNEMHLWTIQDAHDGDVLVNGSNIFIFHFINDTRLMGYCHVNTDDGRFYDDIGKNECFCLIDAVVYPASKEQCDLLFKKMEEAGYEWDVEKKELKKIHIIDEGKAEMDYCFTKMMNGEKVSPTWSEEDEDNLRFSERHFKTFLTNTYYDTFRNWLKSLKDRLKGE